MGRRHFGSIRRTAQQPLCNRCRAATATTFLHDSEHQTPIWTVPNVSSTESPVLPSLTSILSIWPQQQPHNTTVAATITSCSCLTYTRLPRYRTAFAQSLAVNSIHRQGIPIPASLHSTLRPQGYMVCQLFQALVQLHSSPILILSTVGFFLFFSNSPLELSAIFHACVKIPSSRSL